jgi:ParB family chromosome partitioning protein
MGGVAKKLAGKSSKLARPGLTKSVAPSARTGRVLEIDPHTIKPNPWQPRQEFDQAALDDLTDSVREHGILQNLVVFMDGNDVVLIAGERRLRAAKEAGLATVPCRVSDGDPAILALIENIHRRDLTPLEVAAHCAKLKKERGYKLEDLAKITGKSKSTLSEILKLVELPKDVQAKVAEEPAKYPQRLLVELAKEKDAGRVRETVAKVAAGKAEPDKVRTELRKDRAEAKAKSKPKKAAKESDEKHREKLMRHIERRSIKLAGDLALLDLAALDHKDREAVRFNLRSLAQAMDKAFHEIKKIKIEEAKEAEGGA